MTRKKCTKEHPYDGSDPHDWCHPDAKDIGGYDGWEQGTSYDLYECPYCGVKFKEYVGQ